MDHVVAIAIGGASALLMVPLVLLEPKGGIVHACHRFQARLKGRGEGGSKRGGVFKIRSKGISVRAVGFAFCAAGVTVLLGVLSGLFIFIFVGSVVASTALLVCIASRAVTGRNRSA